MSNTGRPIKHFPKVYSPSQERARRLKPYDAFEDALSNDLFDESAADHLMAFVRGTNDPQHDLLGAPSTRNMDLQPMSVFSLSEVETPGYESASRLSTLSPTDLKSLIDEIQSERASHTYMTQDHDSTSNVSDCCILLQTPSTGGASVPSSEALAAANKLASKSDIECRPFNQLQSLSTASPKINGTRTSQLFECFVEGGSLSHRKRYAALLLYRQSIGNQKMAESRGRSNRSLLSKSPTSTNGPPSTTRAHFPFPHRLSRTVSNLSPPALTSSVLYEVDHDDDQWQNASTPSCIDLEVPSQVIIKTGLVSRKHHSVTGIKSLSGEWSKYFKF